MLRAKQGREGELWVGNAATAPTLLAGCRRNSCLFGSLSSEWANTHPGSPISGSKQLKGAVSKIFTNLQPRMSTIYLQEGDRRNNQFLCPGRQIIHGAGGKLHNSVLRSRLPDGAPVLEFQAYLINSGLFCGWIGRLSCLSFFTSTQTHRRSIITLTSYLFS